MTIRAEQRPAIRHIHPWKLLKEGCLAFVADNALTRGAAIAFYAVTAMAPVLFIATAVAGLGLGRDAAKGAVGSELRTLMSQQSADILQSAIIHIRGGSQNLLWSAFGLVVLIITASGVFTEMEDALNVIWKAPRKESYLYQVLQGRLKSLVLVISLGFLLMASVALATGIGVLARYLDQVTSLSHFVISVINQGLSFLLIALLFAAIYKVLPNKALQWRDVIVGAVGTTILFEGGQALIGIYLERFVSANVYGAAAGVMVLLIWVYYSAQVFLLGAEFTKVWAHHYGSQQDAVD